MDKDKEREDLRDLTPEKDAKGGLHAVDLGERPKKPTIQAAQPGFEPVPPIPTTDKDPYSKT